MTENNELDHVLSKEEKLIRNLSIYKSPQKAAREAGYSESFASSTVYVKIKKPSFQKKIRDFYNGLAAFQLPIISQIERKALEHLIDNVGDVPKFSNTLKQIKQSAGVLTPDNVSHITLINIDKAQLLMGDTAGIEHKPSDNE